MSSPKAESATADPGWTPLSSAASRSGISSHDLRNRLLRVLIIGDTIFCFLGLSIGYWLRFVSPLRHVGIESTQASYNGYFPLIAIGTIFFVGAYTYEGLYDPRYLLRPFRSLSIIVRGTFFWVLAFLGISLALKFEPAISRIFVFMSGAATLGTVLGWRYAFHAVLSRPAIHDRIVQRILVIGWTREATRLVHAVKRDQNQPYEIVGALTTRHCPDIVDAPVLGNVAALEAILAARQPTMAIVADVDLTRDELMALAGVCERHYVQFKVIPSFFQTFVSSLQMQTISGVPILGIEEVPLRALHNALLKRSVDIVGALVGLVGTLPVMAVLAFLIKRESPGPIFYRQTRTGRYGRRFTIYKLRSMRVDAEAGTGARWAVPNDNRRLKIGAFMREWNLDELPQYWNILKGDMSLVGPRPERPELIEQFEREIPHYNPRHEVRPGLTGWAQVNGLRGNTSLVARIQYDLYYIENWNVWFDFQIMLLTFFRRQNAY